MNKEEYYSRLKKTTSKLLTDRCSYEESHNIALQQIYLKDKYIKTLEKEKDHYKHLYSEVKKQKDDVVEYIKSYNLPEDLGHFGEAPISIRELREILRMLGEIDE